MPTGPAQMPGSPKGPAPQTPGLRADASRNRDRIVQVARETFATLGLEVPLTEIARRAGVGTATLYRRFPTKESLVTEVFADQIAACASLVDDALADADPWRGFCTVIEKLCAMQTVDRGFTNAFLSAFPGAIDFEQGRAQAERGFGELTERAKNSGRLREDFAPDDLALVLMANGGIRAESAESAQAASRRLVAYLLNTFRAECADTTAPLPPATAFGLHHALFPAIT